MKVKELIQILQSCDPEADVFAHLDTPQKVNPYGASSYKAKNGQECFMACPTEVRRVLGWDIQQLEAVQAVRDYHGEGYSAPYARHYIRRPYEFWNKEQRIAKGVVI